MNQPNNTVSIVPRAAATTVPATTKKQGALVYQAFGSDEVIELTVALVKNFIAVPTKSGRMPSDRDCMKFAMLCKARRLNPWEGDAYLVGYDMNKDGMVIPQFSLITAHQAFLKRAEACPAFDGMESGVIIQQEDGSLLHREGDFHLPEEFGSIVGGWATVHRKDRRIPIKRMLRLARFNKGFAQWKEDPAGMIVKCAEADALRSAFPNQTGGMYLQQERPELSDVNLPEMIVTPDHKQIAEGTVPVSNTVPQRDDPPTKEVDNDDVPYDTVPGEAQNRTANPPAKAPPATTQAGPTPQEELAQFVLTDCGCTWDILAKWGEDSKNIKDATSMGGFNELPTDLCQRLLRSKNGLKKALFKAAGKE